jgi:hypothetical protein
LRFTNNDLLLFGLTIWSSTGATGLAGGLFPVDRGGMAQFLKLSNKKYFKKYGR